jgi:signal transduction histidine kinase
MKKTKLLLLFYFLSVHLAFSQITQESVLKKIDKTLNFYESKKDSIKIMAEEIRHDANSIGLKKEASYYYRFMGFYYEYDGKIDEAAKSYLTYLKVAEENGFIDEKYQAIGDIVNVYISTEQNGKAKKLLLKGIAEGPKEKANPRRLSTYYSNLGVVYRKENKYDSAFYCYSQALALKKEIKDSVGIANVNINLATLLIKQGKYALAKPYVDRNIAFHKKTKSEEDLWYDYANMSEIYLKLNQRKEAEWYVNENVRLAQKTGSKSKEQTSIGDLSDLYRHFGDYKKAYEYYAKYDSLGKTIITDETNKTIAELQEKYEADKREQQNKLLSAEVDNQKQQKLNVILLSIGIALIGLVGGYGWWNNRRKNQLLTSQNDKIQKQNVRLAELNSDKNELISIVSHDLGSPFSSIKLWSSLLGKPNVTEADKSEAVQTIGLMADNGLRLIRNVLSVEKAETNQHQFNLESFDLVKYAETVVHDFGPAAKGKNINIHLYGNPSSITFLSDKYLINRILENLISNALKYSEKDKNIWIELIEQEKNIRLSVKDEGVGIAAEELKSLFAKYSKVSSKPTADEDSTGLGLSITKRIVDELGGKISCKSELGVGSTFDVILPK